MNTKLSATISYSLNNLLHYVCVPVQKQKNNNKTTWLQRKRQNVHTYYTGNRKNSLVFQPKLFNGRSLIRHVGLLSPSLGPKVFILFLYNPYCFHVVTNSSNEIAQFYHFKYSLPVDKNTWGEYSSFCKTSTWNYLHLNCINLYRNCFVLKRTVTLL